MRKLLLWVLGISVLAGCSAASNTAENTRDPANPDSKVVVKNEGISSSDPIADETTAALDEPSGESLADPETSAPELAGAEPVASTPAEQFQAALDKFNGSFAEFRQVYAKAKTQEDRQKAMKLYPDPNDFAEDFLAVAEAHPDSDAAVDALGWVGSQCQGSAGATAIDTLIEKHRDNPKIAMTVARLGNLRSPNAEAQLRELMKSESKEVACMSTYTLANALMGRGETDEEKKAEALKLMEKVVSDYSDVTVGQRNFRVADRAEGALFEIQNLQIGMEAPDIEGKDLLGEEFKLSEYRGKVVLLDFWGHW